MPEALQLLNGTDLRRLFDGRESELVELVARAYTLHHQGETSLPQSSFLRLPSESRSRLIALPAFLGGERPVVGLKWISSFPDNVARGLERASAIIVLNALDSGVPIALLEGSVISAKRTAASAALAASWLRVSRRQVTLGLIGCGRINYEIATFIAAAVPELDEIVVFDIDSARAELLRTTLQDVARSIVSVDCIESVLERASLVSIATTALRPYMTDLSMCSPDAVVLHVSLRDLTPEMILAADNVVDDVEHVCRERTSVHLAEMSVGHRRFVRATLAEVILGLQPPRGASGAPVVFSPFGLGILDVALAALALELANEIGLDRRIADFHPRPWTEDLPARVRRSGA